MATAPESMINHQSLGVCVGEAIVIQNASAVPTSSPSSEVRFHFRISRATKAAEATISPKKKDQISPETRMIGAVNCVRCEGRRLTGYNTDVTGLRASLETFLGGERPERALVLGTGGASQAVQYVLAQMEIPFDLVSRNPATGNYTYDEVSDEVIGSHRLIINASPVGMHPNVEEAPRIPYAFVTPSHYLFDLIYNPAETLFLQYGAQRGAHTCNGLDMLVGQAEAAWAIWNR